MRLEDLRQRVIQRQMAAHGDVDHLMDEVEAQEVIARHVKRERRAVHGDLHGEPQEQDWRRGPPMLLRRQRMTLPLGKPVI